MTQLEIVLSLSLWIAAGIVGSGFALAASLSRRLPAYLMTLAVFVGVLYGPVWLGIVLLWTDGGKYGWRFGGWRLGASPAGEDAPYPLVVQNRKEIL